MEAVGRLTGGIAHGFNNLLMMVSSGLDMIRRPADTARVVKIAETGLEAVARGTRLTRQLLTFARRGDLRPETVNPNALLLGFEPLLRRAVAETVRLDLEFHPGVRPARRRWSPRSGCPSCRTRSRATITGPSPPPASARWCSS